MTRPIRLSLTLALVVVALLSAGCVNSGALFSSNLTNVELGEGNYTLVATNVQGQSEAGYLFGFSGSQGGHASTLALFRVEGNGMLYKEAVENLWSKVEAEHGPVSGRRLALVNMHFDADAANFLGLYTKTIVSVRADVVEFAE